MVVVAVIWIKAGAGLSVRKAAGQRGRAGLLHMQWIVARLALAPDEARRQTAGKQQFAAKKRHYSANALTTASPISTVPTWVVPSLWISGVRRPWLSTLSTAFSMRAAASG
ncbi:MAG: hypothetical protein JWR60_4079 [Polaromonas sp.]|nr:hypothetical protein [Polaromonas sp.]